MCMYMYMYMYVNPEKLLMMMNEIFLHVKLLNISPVICETFSVELEEITTISHCKGRSTF